MKPEQKPSAPLPGESGGDPAAAPRPTGPVPGAPAEPAAQDLTPEEQMARFEKHLKENDWGHQPC
jgi:hypothetical protein